MLRPNKHKHLYENMDHDKEIRMEALGGAEPTKHYILKVIDDFYKSHFAVWHTDPSAWKCLLCLFSFVTDFTEKEKKSHENS
jgi:hypothetical protein